MASTYTLLTTFVGTSLNTVFCYLYVSVLMNVLLFQTKAISSHPDIVIFPKTRRILNVDMEVNVQLEAPSALFLEKEHPVGILWLGSWLDPRPGLDPVEKFVTDISLSSGLWFVAVNPARWHDKIQDDRNRAGSGIHREVRGEVYDCHCHEPVL